MLFSGCSRSVTYRHLPLSTFYIFICLYAGPRSVGSVDESLASHTDADLQPPSPRTTADLPALSSTSMQRLTARVARLKASRDKLLGEVDGQSAELDRLHLANTVLEQVRVSRDSRALPGVILSLSEIVHASACAAGSQSLQVVREERCEVRPAVSNAQRTS